MKLFKYLPKLFFFPYHLLSKCIFEIHNFKNIMLVFLPTRIYHSCVGTVHQALEKIVGQNIFEMYLFIAFEYPYYLIMDLLLLGSYSRLSCTLHK